jgi:cytochrome b6-f complex iron-sulfur subunit
MQKQRRIFLKVLAASPLLAACSSGDSGAPQSFKTVSAGLVSATPVGTLAVTPNGLAILARDAQGLYAMTIICTHAGCDVEPQNGALYCPCHGSRFDSNGKVLQGPAGAALVHFAVSVDAAGNILVDGETQVAADVRVTVS